jgi:hypothetical protein
MENDSKIVQWIENLITAIDDEDFEYEENDDDNFHGVFAAGIIAAVFNEEDDD